ncbi:predicted endoIII-related endonuclease [Chthonomonas calidirosea]|uniref:Predicted EndoIII-related endonuclease n=1 Tax=Chthonomonas calidirosea (strain DSM 23976 / ICMP 18418 / T49) TaxID=1303518 RepID=S0EVF7_CHTCT|nr:endonuclease III [Chthonomonas calidirosea]CCW35758.1 Predicted EndoIII-related endonuclease [Chthonomonas calidirosea T49]CEK19325.1 predicted endoIII-related endonuclease [Chthonomonas calidirosea]
MEAQKNPLTSTETRIREIVRRLEACYGVPEWQPRMSPLDELISCILSQHTSDANSFRAFGQLKERFCSWEAVEQAPTKELADTIRSGGLADSKAARIQAVLRTIREKVGAYDLDFLRQMPDDEARRWLMALPGVGPKTAAIVLCFALGRPVIPVDTHVFRVAWRLGLIEKRVGESKAHDLLQALVPPELIYRFHVALIEHGRRVCKALRPRCEVCPLTDLCVYYQENSVSMSNRGEKRKDAAS